MGQQQLNQIIREEVQAALKEVNPVPTPTSGQGQEGAISMTKKAFEAFMEGAKNNRCKSIQRSGDFVTTLNIELLGCQDHAIKEG